MKKIALDVEGTLADVHTPFIKKYNGKYGTNYTIEDIKNYDLSGVEPSLEEFLEETTLQWKEDWRNIPPTERNLSGKIWELWNLDGVSIDIVTSRKECEEEMEKWLHTEEIPYSDFLVESEKYKLGYDFYIDDNPGLAGKVGGLILYHRPWNEDVDDRRILKRIGKDGSGYSPGFDGAVDFLQERIPYSKVSERKARF